MRKVNSLPEKQDLNNILDKIREELNNLEEAKSLLTDIYEQLKKDSQIGPYTWTRLVSFMEKK